MITYRILIAPIAEGDEIETVEFNDGEGTCHAGEEALFIRTNFDQFGGTNDERVLPWRRILDYRKTEDWRS